MEPPSAFGQRTPLGDFRFYWKPARCKKQCEKRTIVVNWNAASSLLVVYRRFERLHDLWPAVKRSHDSSARAESRYTIGFAGHTHGGQICLPDGTPVLTAGGPLCRSHSRGLFDIPGNGPLIVSRGIGCSNLPVRINSDPELIICRLHSLAAISVEASLRTLRSGTAMIRGGVATDFHGP